MKKMVSLCFVVIIGMVACLHAQIIYVDVAKGDDNSAGTMLKPFASLQKAVAVANQYTGGQITIKVARGFYQLAAPLKIESANPGNDTAKYTIEAMIMPDDTAWFPYVMPVIGSISADNDKQEFDHCAGILVNRSNVCVRGIKFTGNANPWVAYYYPIERDTTTLKNLDISQCYFVGDRYGAVVQGAIYAEGPGIHVNHCVFYGCKNAVLSFVNLSDFSITHSIVYGAYECAFWYGANYPKPGPDQPFIFSDNIVTHCRYFWAGNKWPDHGMDVFKHSLIAGNENYVGTQNGKGGVEQLQVKANWREVDVRKSGNVKLVEVGSDFLPHDYLNLAAGSDGRDIDAGTFNTTQGKPQK